MNRKALALGAVLGFLVAVVPSCGGGKCGPATCGSGCCDSKGACIKDNKNKDNKTCGKDGNTCQDCTATNKTCDQAALTCSGGTGGGMGGGGGTGGGTVTGCNATNCAGCCTGDTCILYTGQDISTCGGGAAACAACTGSQICSKTAQGCQNVVVVDAGPEGGKTGIACTTDTDCGFGSTGNNLRCRFTTTEGDGGYPGGYCTKSCEGMEPCAGDATCVRVPAGWGEPQLTCMNLCDPSNDMCRQPGYECYPVDTDGVCWLTNHPSVPQDGGPVIETVGNACMADTDCQNPPSAAVYCIQLEDGGVQEGYVDGYCARNCGAPERGCSLDGGAVCVNFGSDTMPFLECARVCTQATDGGGQGDCRTGYVCDGPPSTDGGVAQGICIPNCHNPGATWICAAAMCQPNGKCMQ